MRQTNSLSTREEWLVLVAGQAESLFVDQGHDIPEYRVTCGFPSRKALGKDGSVALGQCWSAEHSDGNVFEIFISPLVDDALRVTDILIHELCHAIAPPKSGHGAAFKKIALSVGLEGKMTSTVAGSELLAWIEKVVEGVGPYPHHKLVAPVAQKKPQKSRQMKGECPDCKAEGEPYIIRLSAENIDRGMPICPIHGVAMLAEEKEEE